MVTCYNFLGTRLLSGRNGLRWMGMVNGGGINMIHTAEYANGTHH